MDGGSAGCHGSLMHCRVALLKIKRRNLLQLRRLQQAVHTVATPLFNLYIYIYLYMFCCEGEGLNKKKKRPAD